jgi:hypothetical protein
MICTWRNCTLVAEIPKLDKNGAEWAHLCPKHARAFEDAMRSGDARCVLRAWARAGAGHRRREQLADGIARGCGAIVDFFRKLR